jgi:hypothetical protein
MTDDLDHALDVAVRRTRDAQGRVIEEVTRGEPPHAEDVHRVVRGAEDIDELATAVAHPEATRFSPEAAAAEGDDRPAEDGRSGAG